MLDVLLQDAKRELQAFTRKYARLQNAVELLPVFAATQSFVVNKETETRVASC